MTEIELSITRLAAIGRSPYQIESELGIPHYTIHLQYHAALQAGYARMARLEDSKTKKSEEAPAEVPETTAEEQAKQAKKREKIAEQNRRYYQANKEKLAEWQREHYQANKEKVAERQREYRARKRKEKITQQAGEAPVSDAR